MRNLGREFDVRWSNRATGGGPGGFAGVAADCHSDHVQRGRHVAGLGKRLTR